MDPDDIEPVLPERDPSASVFMHNKQPTGKNPPIPPKPTLPDPKDQIMVGLQQVQSGFDHLGDDIRTLQVGQDKLVAQMNQLGGKLDAVFLAISKLSEQQTVFATEIKARTERLESEIKSLSAGLTSDRHTLGEMKTASKPGRSRYGGSTGFE